MVPFVLPAVLMIAEEASAPDFVQHVLPELKPVMKMTDPIQVTISSDYTLKLLLVHSSMVHHLGCLKLGNRNFDISQVLLIFMQRMDMLLSKTPPTDVKNEVLPMIYRRVHQLVLIRLIFN